MTNSPSPYRENARAESPGKARFSTPAAAKASGLPLSLMALAFFLPATQNCERQVVTPLDVASRDWLSVVWLVPTYLAAALVTLAILHLWKNRHATSALAGAAIALCFASTVTLCVYGLTREHGESAFPYTIPPLVAGVIAWKARRRWGWRRLSLLVDAYAVAAIPVVLLNVSAGSKYGAYLFVSAYASLVVIRAAHVVAWFRARRSQITSNG